MRRILAITIALLAVALLAGCPQAPQDQGSRDATAAPLTNAAAPGGQEPVTITAYINVSSGCQQPTVDLLERLAGENDRLELELIDFGADEGSRRWRQDGYDCMTILIDGSQTVTFGPPDKRQIVSFLYPPGFQWTLEDLEAAINDALAGSLVPGEEAGATRIESRMPTLRLASREATVEGKKVGQVLVNGTVAIEIKTEYDNLPPLQRAEEATARLKRAMAQDFKPADIHVPELAEGKTGLAVEDRVICVANEEEAKLAGKEPKALAQEWAESLKKALTAALSGQE